jgi:hypothetical protein
MCNWRLNVYYRSHFYPYCFKIGRMLKHILLYGVLKGFYKLFISCEVIALAIDTLNQAVFGCTKGIKTEISDYMEN